MKVWKTGTSLRQLEKRLMQMTRIPTLPDSSLFTDPRPVNGDERLHVVMVDEELPYPPTSGKRIRTLNLTLRLARRHHITYVCHRNADAQEARQAAIYFAEQGIAPVVVDHAVPRKSGPGFYFRLAANLASPLPFSVASHMSSAMRKALRELATSQPIDLWHCEWTPYAQAARRLNGRPRLVMAHNLESLIWERYYETERDPIKRWYIKRQWRKFQRFERRTFAEANQVVTVSDQDADRVAMNFGGPKPEVVENGVDTSFFRPFGEEREPAHILFLGSLDWRPNLDAVELLLDEVFPAVRALEPSARLIIVGRHPPDWLGRALQDHAAVSLHGDVVDVRPYLAGCGILAVPLRVAGGSRLKILEALACETPVVSTQIGAEGLHLENGRHLDVVERVEDLASALVRSIQNPQQAQAQAREGRKRVLDRYDWDNLADKLEQVWLTCAHTARGSAKGVYGSHPWSAKLREHSKFQF
jgi:glycosyltransferase involved in cell wall biosynthesis